MTAKPIVRSRRTGPLPKPSASALCCHRDKSNPSKETV